MLPLRIHPSLRSAGLRLAALRHGGGGRREGSGLHGCSRADNTKSQHKRITVIIIVVTTILSSVLIVKGALDATDYPWALISIDSIGPYLL